MHILEKGVEEKHERRQKKIIIFFSKDKNQNAKIATAENKTLEAMKQTT